MVAVVGTRSCCSCSYSIMEIHVCEAFRRWDVLVLGTVGGCPESAFYIRSCVGHAAVFDTDDTQSTNLHPFTLDLSTMYASIKKKTRG